MTDEGKITCNGLGVIPSDRVRPTPPGWREGPLPSYDRCPGCAACPPTAEQLIEARVRAEVAERLSQQANDLRAAYRRGPYKHSIDYIEGWEDAGNWLESIAAGSSPDTTPEDDRPCGRQSLTCSRPPNCLSCHPSERSEPRATPREDS